MKTKEEMYDAVCVSTNNGNVLWVDGNKTYQNAEAVTRMGIMRQGLEDRFFVVTRIGMYKEGDKYSGDGGVVAPKEDPDYVVIGGTMYPRGKRGL